jgi:hypothetical protein
MDEEKIASALGRIDEAIRGQSAEIARLRSGLYGDGGLEPRIRATEQDIVKLKTIWTTVAAVVGGLASYLSDVFRR